MAHWLLLITNLPGRNQTLRMRLWRALKAAGSASLRDGVYLLPSSKTARRVFESQATQVQSARGSAHVLSFEAEAAAQQRALEALFDRATDYAGIMARLAAWRRKLAKLDAPAARRGLEALRRDLAQVVRGDFFPGASRQQVEGALADATVALAARFSPNEPHAVHRRIARRDPGDYRGRTWATRERLWIDRVCSAWLIRRFIDPKAKFLWLRRAKDCPKRAIGFDFDGAVFSHVDTRVTFEVLLASFGLEHDSALARLAGLVHYLDVGGVPIPEAAGLAAIVTGARTMQPDDTALLGTVTPVLDSLYAHYSLPVQVQP
jgi:hypothetical protein